MIRNAGWLRIDEWAPMLTREEVAPLIERFVKTDETGYYGFYIRRGWYELLENTFKRMTEAGWDGHLHQVKEKFGLLKIYVDRANEDVYDAIDDGEAESSYTCELCAGQGERRAVPMPQTRKEVRKKMQPYHYMITLCDACHTKVPTAGLK